MNVKYTIFNQITQIVVFGCQSNIDKFVRTNLLFVHKKYLIYIKYFNLYLLNCILHTGIHARIFYFRYTFRWLNMASAQTEVLDVPEKRKGLIIGTRRSGLIDISNKTGAKLFLSTSNQICATGNSEQIQEAKAMIEKKLVS